MTAADIRAHLCSVLTDVQQDGGKEKPDLKDTTVPLTDLPDMDSLVCVDASVRLSERLGVEIKLIPFHDDKEKRDLTIAEIVAEVEKLCSRQQPLKPKSRSRDPE